jgi:hypothetical protein
MVSKQCGNVTYCHTLVRPGYCPFCMNDRALPASERLESWTRDHKLWSHVNEHLGQCRWPCTCPHPFCDASVENAVALQFRFMDHHGFSRARRGKAASLNKSDSPDEKTSSDNKDEVSPPNRKQKSLSSAVKLEWLSPLSAQDASAHRANFSQYYPHKRSRPTSAAICPALLTTHVGVSDDQSTCEVVDSAVSSAQYSQSIEEQTHFDYRLPPSCSTRPCDTTDANKVEDGDCDTLFGQYLRSLSPSPPPASPDDASSQFSESTLVDARYARSYGSVRSHTFPSESTAPEAIAEDPAARDQEDLACVSNRRRIRLLVRQPKITLHFKLQNTTSGGKKRKNDKKIQKINKQKRRRTRTIGSSTSTLLK